MSLRTKFKTNTDLETKGVYIDYGDFRVKVARAGGSNKKFLRMSEARFKPYRRQIQNDTLDSDVADKVTKEIFAATVILDWETKVEGKWKQGIEIDQGKLLPFTKENIMKVFEEFQDLYLDIREQAINFSLFKLEEVEEDSKNS